MEDRAGALGEIAWDVLRRIVRELLARKSGGHLVEASLDRLDVRLPLQLKGPDADPEAFSRELVAALDRLLDDAIQHAAAFRPGHAFCHRCEAALCEHSEPPSGRHVFVGYAPTGLPRWEDFAQLCLDLRHPEVDRLYEDPPALVALVQDRAALNRQILGAFHHERIHDLLGQVTAGFYSVRAREGEGRTVLAITFQVAASRPRQGGMRLGLNVLGRTPEGGSLDLIWERQAAIPWQAAARWAQSALQSLEQAHRSRRGDLERRVAGILSGLTRRLQRDHRARSRRTHHAERRHLSGERPTRMAFDDMLHVRPQDVLFDERHGTLVVPGDRGRTHFYTPEGRLVSSVRYSRDAIDRKQKLGLWRAAPVDQAAALLERLRGQL